jgi:hypothetical protein
MAGCASFLRADFMYCFPLPYGIVHLLLFYVRAFASFLFPCISMIPVYVHARAIMFTGAQSVAAAGQRQRCPHKEIAA